MDYCAYSAAPVGRFVLDVHGESESTWPASDALCTALQVINHLQDCGADYRTLDRIYVPQDALAAQGLGVRTRSARKSLAGAARGFARAWQSERAAGRVGRSSSGAGSRFPPMPGDRRDRAPRAQAQFPAARTRSIERKGSFGQGRRSRLVRHRYRRGLLAFFRPRQSRRRRSVANERRVRHERRCRCVRARARQLFQCGDAYSSAPAPRGDVRNLFLLPRRRRHRGRSGAASCPLASARRMAARYRRALRRPAPAQVRRCAASPAAIHAFGLRREDFRAIIDGMEMDVEADIRAPDFATLDLYCDRVASAVGRLSVQAFRDARGGRPPPRASSWPRPAAHQYLARSRRGRGDRPALSAARGLCGGGHQRNRGAARGSRRSGAGRRPARRPSRGRRSISTRRQRIMARCPRASVRAPRIMARSLSRDSRRLGRKRGFDAAAPTHRRTPRHRVLSCDCLRYGHAF